MQNDRVKIKGINSQGYGTIPKMVMLHENLSIEAKAIYAYFASFSGNGDTSFPNRNLILKHLKIGKDRFYCNLKQLIQYNFIEIEQIKIKGKFSHNVYYLVQNPNVSPCPCFPYTGDRDTINNSIINNTINIKDNTNINIIKSDLSKEKNVNNKIPYEIKKLAMEIIKKINTEIPLSQIFPDRESELYKSKFYDDIAIETFQTRKEEIMSAMRKLMMYGLKTEKIDITALKAQELIKELTFSRLVLIYDKVYKLNKNFNINFIKKYTEVVIIDVIMAGKGNGLSLYHDTIDNRFKT